MNTMRLTCPCGRNLADVTHVPSNPDWTTDSLVVTPRPNVNQDDFRPWEEAHRNKRIGPEPQGPDPVEVLRERYRLRRAGVPESEWPKIQQDDRPVVSKYPAGLDADWHERTYTWHCRCGQTSTARHARVGARWTEHQPSPDKMVTLVISRDV